MAGKKYLESENIYMFNNYLSFLIRSKYKNKRIKSQNWHRDPEGRKLFKFFIFFNDVSESNGAFEYIPRSQYTSQNRITTLYDYGETYFGSIYPDRLLGPQYPEFQKVERKHRKIMTFPAGTIIFADTSGFHRAGISQSGKYRKYLVGQFRSLRDLGLLKAYNISNKSADKHYIGYNFNSTYQISYDQVDSILGDKGRYFYNPAKQSCQLPDAPKFYVQKHPLDVPELPKNK